MKTATPTYLTFCDLDGTLISTRSLVSFLDFLLNRSDWPAPPWLEDYLTGLGDRIEGRLPRADLNAYYYTLFRGQTERSIRNLGQAWFEVVRHQGNFFNPGILEEIRRHQDADATIVLVTGSFDPLVKPVARFIGCDHWLCTRLEVEGDRYTGRLVGEPCIGPVKEARVREFAMQQDLPLANAFAYGDDDTDRPMLEAVGHARWVASSSKYRNELSGRRWSRGPRRSVPAQAVWNAPFNGGHNE